LGLRIWRKNAEDHEEWAIILKNAVVKLSELCANEEEESKLVGIVAH
jgi:hypothetical protein